jgi:FKBP-type peptidyl-prolyl cis-trans isomerase FklB
MSHPFQTLEQRVSYGIGQRMGGQLASNPFTGLDPQAVAAGLIHALQGQPSQVPGPELDAAFAEITQRMKAQEAQKAKQQAAAGEAFLAQNAQRPEVVVTASGLQYEILQAGTGTKPSASSTVKTHYHGTLIDGSVFDSSVERGQTAEFPVNRVIAGWTEALQLMPVGSKWRLFIPYQLAYGEQGAGGAIAPYSALIFEVELIDVVA